MAEESPIHVLRKRDIGVTYATSLPTRADADARYDSIGSAAAALASAQSYTDNAVAFSGALVTISANQSINNNTPTFINWDAEEYDTDGYHDNVTNNTRLTVPEDGWYVISGGAVFASNATGYRRIQIFRNGTAFRGRATHSQNAVNGLATSMATSSSAFLCTAGDYFEFEVTQTSGGALNVITNTSTYFAIRRIAPP